MDGSHVDWWEAVAPEVAAHFAPDSEPSAAPDPLWIDHGTAVLRAATEEAHGQGALPEYTLPVGFSEEDGFEFRTGHVRLAASSPRTPARHSCSMRGCCTRCRVTDQ